MAWIGGAISGIASIFGGQSQADAAEKAAKIQAQSADKAIAFEKSIWDQIQAQLAPWLKTGGDANNMLAQLLGLGGGDGTLLKNPADLAGLSRTPTPYTPLTADTFRQSPGYQFQLGQGLNAVTNSAAAKGLTGNTLADLAAVGTGLADQDWTAAYGRNIQDYQLGNLDYWNRYNAASQQQGNIFQRLFGVSGAGQNAATNQGQAGLQVGNTVGGALIGQGNALAAGQVGAANAQAGGFNNAINALLKALQGGSSGNSNNNLAWLFGGGGGWDNAATAGTGGF